MNWFNYRLIGTCFYLLHYLVIFRLIKNENMVMEGGGPTGMAALLLGAKLGRL